MGKGKRRRAQKGKGNWRRKTFLAWSDITYSIARTHARTTRNKTISRLDSPPNLRFEIFLDEPSTTPIGCSLFKDLVKALLKAFQVLLVFAVLCFALLCFAWLFFTLHCINLHWLAFLSLLCFALLCFALLCFCFFAFLLLLCFPFLSFALLCFYSLCFALLCFAFLCFALLCLA